MIDKDEGLGRLCLVYEKFDVAEKEKLIRLGEGLLNSQKITNVEKAKSTEKKEMVN